NTAYISKKLVWIQPILDAEIAKSKEICGRTIFTPEEMRGIAKEENETVRRSPKSCACVSLGF
ncbi:MAG: hypothetical protein FWF19_00725, partial [Euryarchaeota archaeon]|nr:hypothetical protein [Euryarchaeota archaeon]